MAFIVPIIIILFFVMFFLAILTISVGSIFESIAGGIKSLFKAFKDMVIFFIPKSLRPENHSLINKKDKIFLLKILNKNNFQPSTNTESITFLYHKGDQLFQRYNDENDIVKIDVKKNIVDENIFFDINISTWEDKSHYVDELKAKSVEVYKMVNKDNFSLVLQQRTQKAFNREFERETIEIS